MSSIDDLETGRGGADRADSSVGATVSSAERRTGWSDGRAVTGTLLVVVAAYLTFLLAAMVSLGVTPSADTFVVAAAILAIALGRGRAFVRDWAPFALILLAWEGMRGIASAFGQSVNSDSVVALERALLGTVPSVDLQQALYAPGQISVLDVVLASTYTSHFFFPLAFAFVWWARDRPRYYDFAFALTIMSFAAFVTYVVVPVAPPRFAGDYGQALAVYDITKAVAAELHWTGAVWLYGNLVGNPVAAFPSLHAAYPILVLLFLAERSKLAAVAWLPAVGVIWFATVYLGHHYVVDLVGGLLFAIAAFALVRTAAYRRLLERLDRPSRPAGSA